MYQLFVIFTNIIVDIPDYRQVIKSKKTIILHQN